MADKNTKTEQKFYQKWWFWVIIAFVIIGLGAGAGTSNKNSDESKTGNEVSYEDKTSKDNGKTVGLGDTFKFDDLEITLGTTVTYKTLENEFSDHNGDTIIEIPITVKNIKEETHNLNMYSYKVFGSKGTEVDTASAYFMENSIDFGGELRTGATITKNLYFYYDGDGEYVIEFGYVSTEKIVKFEIKK
mgnify:CR=1 FL=1